MTTTGVSDDAWRRSSASIPFNDCVEVLINKDEVRVRDSKHERTTALRFGARSWHSFLRDACSP